jgi:hypothetical protein
LRNPLKQRKNEFELEVLEPRVMLSGDALLTAAFAEAGTHVHRAATASHEASNATQTQLSEHAAPAASDIFEGMCGTAIQSAQPGASTAKSTDAVRTNVAVKASPLPAASAKIIAPNSKISSSTVAASGSAMAEQLTATLKAANGPPGSSATLQVLGNQDIASSLPTNKVKQNVFAASSSSAVPQGGSSTANLFQTIVSDISAIASGNGTASISLPSASLGGVLTFQSVQVALTISGNSVTAVTIQTGTASLNLGGGVTSSIQSATGSYNVSSQTFSMTLNTVAIAFSSFVNVTAGSASVTYVGGNSTNVTLSNNTTKPVSLLEIGISNASIFAGVNGPASQSGAVGVELDNASLGLALMSASDGTLYYGLQTTVGTLRAVGLPSGFTMSATNLGMQINSSTDGSNVVNFDQSFVRGTGLAVSVGSTSINLDYQQQFFEASGTIDLAFNGFVDIQGGMAIEYMGSQSVTVTGSSTPVTVSTLTIGASVVTIFAGDNGPASNSGAVGVELQNAGFALALMKAANGTTYFGLMASADSLAAVGLPANTLQLSGTSLNLEINGSSGGTGGVVNYDASFPGSSGNGLSVPTGPGTSQVLDFTQEIVQVQGALTLGVAGYIQVGGGFSFTQTSGGVDFVVGSAAFSNAPVLAFAVGTASNPIFSATGSLSITITPTTFTINNASLTVSASTPLKIASVLEVVSPSVTLSNLSIDLASGDMTGTVGPNGAQDPVLTVTAESASLFPGNTCFTGSVTPTSPGGLGFQGTFDLATGTFSITLQQFQLAVGSVFTASSSNVLVTYNPSLPDSQQIVQIGTGTLDFKVGSSDIIGSLTNLTIYGDGFHFDSVTISYSGSVSLGSLLTLTGPSVTLTDFGVTFGSGGGVTEGGSLTVGVTSASLNIGSFTASVSSLSITIDLSPATLGNLSITAGEVDFKFSTYLDISASNISINTNPGNGGTYFSVGTASATLTITSSFTIGGSVSNFSVTDNNGTPELQEGANFSVSLTPPSPSQLGLPNWLGFSITRFTITWPGSAFTTDPTNFQITLSAGISSIQGVPSTVSVSGYVNDVIINVGELGSWLQNPSTSNFPISFGPDGGIGGSLSGTLFGLDFSAAFVGGIVTFNREGDIIDGTTITGPSSGLNDPVVYGSGFYIGVSGSASIPGVGAVTASLGFSNLGPLAFYLSYTGAEGLILDPDSGLEINSFSAGVAFDTSMETPATATDLPGVLASAMTAISGSATGSGNVNASQWATQLELATAAQFISSNGGTNPAGAYTQPFLVEGSVGLSDAYAPDSIAIQGQMVLCINPSATGNQPPVSILVVGTVTLGGATGLSAGQGYLYASISAASAQLMFLVDMPASVPIEEFGGGLTFSFITANGQPASLTNLPTGCTLDLNGFFEYSAAGLASISVTGNLTLTITASQTTIDFSADINVSFLGDLGDASGELVLLYPGSTYAGSSATATTAATASFTNNSGNVEIYGALDLYTGSALAALQNYGLVINGATLFQINTTGQTVTVNLPPTPSQPTGSPSTPFDVLGSVYFEMTVSGTASANATISYEVDNQTLFQMEGFFDLRVINDPTNGLEVQLFANIQTLTLGPPGAQFLSFSGFGLILIDGQGLSAEMNLTLGSGNAIPELSFNANFDLVINTTSQPVTFTVPTVTVPGSATGTMTTSGITIHNPDGSTSTVTSLVIPAGPPQGALQDISGAGAYTTVGPTGPYLVVTGSGGLTILPDYSAFTLSLSGFFYFQVSYSASAGTVVELVLNVNGTVGSLGQANVTGDFQLSEAGVVALLDVSVSGGTSTGQNSYGPGVTLDITAELGINTTNEDINQIGADPTDSTTLQPGNVFLTQTTTSGGTTTTSNITLSADSFQIVASGTLTIDLGSSGNNFVITGVFGISTSGDQTTITASGTLKATVDNATLLTMDASGVLIYTSGSGADSGIAGELTLTLTGADPLSGVGFSFSGSYDLELNTTLASQSATVYSSTGAASTVTIAAGPNGSSTPAAYAEVHANGTITFGSSTDGFELTGDFFLAVGSDGLDVSLNTTLSVVIGSQTLLSSSASGGMLISSTGFAASLTATATLTDGQYYAFGGTFTLNVNTTGTTQTVGTDITVPATANGGVPGPYVELAVSGTLALGTTTTNSSTGTGIYLTANNFDITITSSGLAISVSSATLELVVAGTPFFTLNATGAFLISDQGMAARVSVTGSSIPQDSVFAFHVSLLLEVNTTGQTVSSINGQTVNLPAKDAFGNEYYVDLKGTGMLTLAGFVNINGAFTFAAGNTGVNLEANGTVMIMGVVFTINADAGIYSDGIAINATLGVSGGGSAASFLSGIVTISANFQLQINNTGQSHFGVAPGTAFVLSIYGSGGPGSFADVYVFGFDFQGALSIKVNTSGVFVAQGQLAFNFFNFATLTVAFYFNSSGQYYFYGSIYVQLGSNSFNIHGSLTVAIANISATFSYTDANNHTSTVSVSPGFLMAVNGGVTAFDFTFASVGASVEINGSSVSISAYVSVNFGLFSIGGTVTIHLGSLANVPTPPPPAIAQVSSGSTTINGETFGAGTLVLNIGDYASGRGVAAQASENYTITPVPGQPGDVYVDAPGIYGQPIEYKGVSEIVVPEADTSNVNVQIDPGVTIPVVIFAGSGTNQFITGGGQATIHGTSGNDTVIGGSGGAIFYAGSGTSQFIGGTGNNTIYDPGAVSVIEGYTSATYDSTTDTTNPDPIYYSYYILSGSTLTYGNGTTDYTDTLVGSFSSITLTAPSSGATTFQVSNYSGNVTLNGNGNSSVTTSIELDAGNMSLTGNTVTESNGASGIITLQGINTVSLLGGPGNNAFTVNSWSGTGAVDLNGAGGSNTYTINFQSGGSLTANVSDTGMSGTMIVNGPVGNGTINVNGGSVSFGSQLVNYSGIEDLTVYTNTGNDTVNITGTTAATTVNAGSGNDTVNVTGVTDATTINLGSGTNTVNVGTLAPAETGGALSSIQAQLTVNGGNGGTDTLYLDDSGDNSTSTITLTTGSLTGVFGAGGSLDYSSMASLSLYLGNGAHTVNVQGMDGTVNISLGSGANTLNIGSNAGPIVTNASTGDAANTGSVLTQITGILNFTGAGANTFNVDDSGSNVAVQAALNPTSLLFLNLVTINFTNAAAMNFSLSQSGDVFAVQDTFPSASASPVIVVDGNGGDDTFVVVDTHAVMTLNGGDGGDSFYVLGNSSVLNLNGDAGNDDFYIYASVDQNTSNVSTGSGNSQVYSYRVNAAINIDGGSGDNTVHIFGTSLNDTFTINGTHVSGAGIDVTYTNIQQLVVEGLGGNNTFYIEAVTIPTTVIGNGSIVPVPSLAALGITLPNLNGNAPPATSFNDTFYVGWQGASYLPGSLAGFTAPLTIYGYNGPDMNGATVYPAGAIDTIYVNDSGDTANQSFALTPNLLTSTAMGTGGEMFYDTAISNLDLTAGPGNNTFVVNGTGANAGTSIYGGSGLGTFIVDAANGGSLASPLGIFGGSITYPADTLTVNGAGDGNTFDITGTSVDGAGAVITYQSIAQLTVNAGGPTTFNVNGDLVPTHLNGENSGDTFNVNNSVAPLYISGGTGNDTYLINGNSSALAITDSGGVNRLTVTGNAGNLAFVDGGVGDTIVIDGNSGSLTVSETAGANTFTVDGNGGILTLNGGSGDDSFTVNALGAPATLNGGTGNNTFAVNGPLAASLSVNGGGAAGDVLTINGTAGNDTVTIKPSVVEGLGAPVNYTGTNLVINGVAGNDTFYILNTSLAATTINGGIDGSDTFNIQSSTAALNLNGGTGASTFNLGSLAPTTGGTLGQLAGAVNILGGTGVSTINVDDTGDVAVNAGLLTANTLTGLGMGAGLTYARISVLNINVGSGNDTFNVQGTSAATVTTLNTGTGADIVNLGSLAPVAGGVLSGIEGALVIVGGGNDALNVDDTGATARITGVLTANTLTGLGMGAKVTYSGVAGLKINFGSGSDTLCVESTAAATVTTLNTGAGVDTVKVGSEATLGGIQGALVVVGGGSDTLIVDDTDVTANTSATLSATTLTGLGMGPGGITYSGLAVLNIFLNYYGDNTLSVTGVANATATILTGGSGTNTARLNFSGNFAGTNLTLVNFVTATLNVGGDFSGSLTDAGAITPVSIGGSLTSTGVLTAGSISTMTVGGNMAGLITVHGLLGTLAVSRGTPGKIVVGDIHLITVQAGSGNILLNVVENGVEREILATPVSGGNMPGMVQFAFVYDSETTGTPQVAIRITDSSPVARSFNLALVVVNSSTALFNLALVDSTLNGNTGISNISVQGSLLTRLTTPEWQFFPGLKAASRAGVVLPACSITGVEVSGTLPIGFIDVRGIEGLAFARLTTANGTPVSFTSQFASQVLWNLLGSKTAINSATDAFVVPFGLTAVRLFSRDGIGAVLNQVMTFAYQLHDNSTVTAYVQLAPATRSGVNPLAQSMMMVGDGGSINSVLSIANLTSTGPLGNVTITASAGETVNNAAGLGNVTAPDIFGNIDVTQAGIYGVIQSTSGDIGETTARGVTSILTDGAFTGAIISAGNLVSSVIIHGAFSGVIAAQDDIGAIKRTSSGSAVTTSSGALTQYGGVSINGRDSGQIISLGNIFGNITVTATMTGRIAVQGQAVAGCGASRIGILGNVTIHSCAAGSAIVSGGVVGDATGKTAVKLGQASGFVAAQSSVNMKSTTIGPANLLQNVTGSNLSAIKAIFTNGGAPLQFNSDGNLQGLMLIEVDLKNLENSAGSLSGPIQ